MTDPVFDRHYYQSENYEHYLTRTFDGLAGDLEKVLRLDLEDYIIDFGCGFGGLINALHQKGYIHTLGTDISNWAIEYGKAKFSSIRDCLQYYNRNVLAEANDHIVMLDILEHMPEHEIETVLTLASKRLRGYLVARIPVSEKEGKPFMLDVSNKDRTHITCHTKNWWYSMFERTGYRFEASVSEEHIYDSPGVLVGLWRRIDAPRIGTLLDTVNLR